MPVPVKNLTRLNTDDLIRLVNEAERLTAEFNSSKTTSTRATEFEFTIYTGSGQERQRNYNTVTRSYEYKSVKRYIGRAWYSEYGRIAVLPPDRMFDSPLQLLSLDDVGVLKIPDDALRALFNAICQRFDRQYRSGVEFKPDPVALGLSVRIEGRVAARRSATDARLMRLSKAKTRLHEAGYHGREGITRLRRSLNVMRAAKSHLIRDDKGMEVPHALALAAAIDAMETALAVHVTGFEHAVEALSDSLSRSGSSNG